jgi:histidine ammonia-lyase
MGANAATKCLKVIENVERIYAIELMNASQALEFRRPLKSSAIIEKMVKKFRSLVPIIEDDKLMYAELEAALQFIKQDTSLIN